MTVRSRDINYNVLLSCRHDQSRIPTLHKQEVTDEQQLASEQQHLLAPVIVFVLTAGTEKRKCSLIRVFQRRTSMSWW